MDTTGEEVVRRQLSQVGGNDAVVATPQKRRRYSTAYKRRVVEETLTGGDSVSIVARRHDINTNLLFNWRKHYLAGKYDEESGSPLIPITVTALAEAPAKASGQVRAGADRLEVVLSSGHRLVAEGPVDPAVLRTALEVLKG